MRQTGTVFGMDRIRHAVLPGQIASIDGEEPPNGAEPDYAEATPDYQEGERPDSEGDIELVLNTRPTS